MWNIFRSFILILCLSNLMSDVYAQKQEVFYDNFGIQGKVNYQGEWLQNQFPEFGPYAFSWRNINDNKLSTFYAKGQLKNHQPNGVWLFENGLSDFQIQNAQGITSEFINQGTKHQWNGQFNNGIAHGKWIYIVNNFQNKVLNNRPITKLEQEFSNNKLIGNFVWFFDDNGQKIQIKGQCNSNGEAHGTWHIEFKKDEVLSKKLILM